MSPLEERDYERLILFEKEIEKKVKESLEYYYDSLMKLNYNVDSIEKILTKHSSSIAALESTVMVLKERLEKEENKHEELNKILIEPKDGVIVKQRDFSIFIEGVKKDLEKNEMHHNELKDSIKEINKKITTIMYIGLIISVFVLTSNPDVFSKIFKLFLKIF